MRNDRTKGSRTEAREDIGTLWSMTRGDHRARCALMASQGDWEIRVLVDGVSLLSEPCEAPAEAFMVAEKWKHTMIARGWRQVSPPSGCRPSLERSTA